MNMKVCVYSLFVCYLLTLTHLAHARIGETEKECADRYGAPSVPKDLIEVKDLDGIEPTVREDKVLEYHKDGATIYIEFLRGKAVSMQYFFHERKEPLRLSHLTALLQRNLPQHKWLYNFNVPVVLTDDPAQVEATLVSTDGQYYAVFKAQPGLFLITQSNLRPTFRPDNSPTPELNGL
jgi:hypothetical protein